jgi:hypothetical protein
MLHSTFTSSVACKSKESSMATSFYRLTAMMVHERRVFGLFPFLPLLLLLG